MPINLAGFQFTGPFKSTALIEDKAGIYGVVCFRDGEIQVLELGESSRVRAALKDLESVTTRWQPSCGANLAYVVFFTPGERASRRQQRLAELKGLLPEPVE